MSLSSRKKKLVCAHAQTVRVDNFSMFSCFNSHCSSVDCASDGNAICKSTYIRLCLRLNSFSWFVSSSSSFFFVGFVLVFELFLFLWIQAYSVIEPWISTSTSKQIKNLFEILLLLLCLRNLIMEFVYDISENILFLFNSCSKNCSFGRYSSAVNIETLKKNSVSNL